MKALAQDRYGSAQVVHPAEIEVPSIGDTDVLVRMRAVSLHRGDWHLMTGLPYLTRVIGFGVRAPRTRTRGMDIAGTVESVGRSVTELKPGDEVFGVCTGALAEFAAARADLMLPKPTAVTFVQAAAVPTSAVTALQALRDAGRLTAGQSVLVIGAAGGVGIFAVQLVRAFGAEVTGVCSTTKLDLVRSIGADHVIDYTREDFVTSGRRYDLIIDTAGNRSLSRLRRALTPHGTLVIVGGESAGRWSGGFGRQIRAMVLSPFVSQRLRGLAAVQRRADLTVIREMLAAGTLTPVIDRTYPLAEGRDALLRLESGDALGKIVVTSV
jgi:NADPH:quinone reductase-like Zn-dependent oxidoreductase